MGLNRIPYYGKDYDSIKSNLITEIKNTEELKGIWTDFSENDFGVILLELFSGVADLTSFNIDNQAAETFLDTARKRKNVYRIAKMLGYSMQTKIAATTSISFNLPNALDHNYTLPIGTKFKTSGVLPRIFTSNEVFVVPSSGAEKRSCSFISVVTAGNSKITDVGLSGISIPDNTLNGVIYCKFKNESSKNKIALYRSSARTGNLDSSSTDVDKIGYGEVASGTYIIPISAVNGSGISGNIYIGNSNFSGSLVTAEELHIKGPICFEGEEVIEVFTSSGQINQRFNLQYAIQKLPNTTKKAKSLSVNGVTWEEVEDMFFDQQNYFTVETIEHDFSTIIFGDGNSGNVPPTDATISITYIKGNGASGHVGAGKITGVLTALTEPSGASIIAQCTNIGATNNAADEESIASTKKKAIQFFKTRSRAVHETDYEALIKDYKENGELNPEIVQAIKNESEPDLVNEIEIFILSRDSSSGRPISTTIDLSTSGGLWSYIAPIKTIPEGIRKSSNGEEGFQQGSLDTSTANFYFTIFKILGFDREVVREAVRTAVISYYHSLTFQDKVELFALSKIILGIQGIQSVQVYTNSGRTIAASGDAEISGWPNRGKILTLQTGFYTVGEKVYIKIDGDV